MIIESLLDTDLYKFTMQQAVYHRFKDTRAEYLFRCRDANVDFRPIAERVRREIDRLGDLRLTAAEIEYLGSLGFFAPDYLKYLCGLRLDPGLVEIRTAGEFTLSIKGGWLETILFEVPVLAIANECYFDRAGDQEGLFAEGRRRLDAKLSMLAADEFADLRIAEFGTRRRFSRRWQEDMLERIKNSPAANRIPGTSNLFFARKYDLAPVGTMAHEFLQACQAQVPLREFQTFALKTWLDEYRGALGIALSDVVGIDAFLADFDAGLAGAYAGVRHDSGNPFLWGEKVIDHYRKLGIDPAAKTLVFSDGLDLPTALEIHRRFAGRTKVLFGIGTNLTNDLGPRPLNIVIKMVRCNERPVAKISDSPGKGMCEDPDYVERLKEVFWPRMYADKRG